MFANKSRHGILCFKNIDINLKTSDHSAHSGLVDWWCMALGDYLPPGSMLQPSAPPPDAQWRVYKHSPCGHEASYLATCFRICSRHKQYNYQTASSQYRFFSTDIPLQQKTQSVLLSFLHQSYLCCD